MVAGPLRRAPTSPSSVFLKYPDARVLTTSSLHRKFFSPITAAAYFGVVIGIETLGSFSSLGSVVIHLPLLGWLLWLRRCVVTRLVYHDGSLRVWTAAGPLSSKPLVIDVAAAELPALFDEQEIRTRIAGHPRLLLKLVPRLSEQLR